MSWDKRATIGAGVAAGAALIFWSGYNIRQANRDSAPLAPVGPNGVEILAGGNSTQPSTTAPASIAPVPTPTPKEIVVHVTGAVRHPGVYTLKPGTRIFSAVQAAGGLRPDAKEDALNQADFLHDCDQLYFMTRAEWEKARTTRVSMAAPKPMPQRSTAPIAPVAPPVSVPTPSRPPARLVAAPPIPIPPVVVPTPAAPLLKTAGRVLGREPQSVPTPTPVVVAEESGAPASAAESDEAASRWAYEQYGQKQVGSRFLSRSGTSRSSSSGTEERRKTTPDHLIDLNTASAEELQKLPGVGEALAGRILGYRQQIGRFSSVEQLQEIRGFGAKTFAKIAPFVRVE